MANPFLFDEVPSEPQNPFLMNDAPAPVEPANPFLMDGGGGGGMGMQPQSNFGVPDVAANPFASYGAPMYNDPNAQMGNYYYQQQQQPQQPQAAFVAQQQQHQGYASPQHQQGYVQPQHQQIHPQHAHHQQQFAGQYGPYTQVTADSYSQPAVTPAFVAPQPPPVEPVPQAAVTSNFSAASSNPFGAVADEPPPSPPIIKDEVYKIQDLPPPSPPPAEVVEEAPPASVEEDATSLPPPPMAEVLPTVADEPLPAPPEETVQVRFWLKLSSSKNVNSFKINLFFLVRRLECGKE